MISPKSAVATPRTKPSVKKRAATTKPAALPGGGKEGATDQLMIDTAWPLPAPDYLVLLLSKAGRNQSPHETRPHLEVLLDLAIGAKQPDEVLRWFGHGASGAWVLQQ